MHCIECDELLTAIEAFIAKADKSLADELERAGFAESEETVKQIEELEEELAEVFEEQSDEIEKLIQDAAEKGLSFDETKKLLEDFKKTDNIKDKLFPIFLGRYTEYVPHLANIYIADMDSELIVEQISKKTTGWISQWSYELSELMHLSSYNEIEAILEKGLKNGNGIDAVARDILENGIRDEYYKAKRVAVTEILRAHSMAQEEAIQQCPASEFKEWIHTGGHKNKPRENHVKMNGQRVPKNQNFKLIGADGITYLADFPHDPALPAGETINCHCIHRGVPSAEILGLPLEERKRLQQQAIAEMDDKWEAELDAKNKARAGITVDNPDKSGIIESKEQHHLKDLIRKGDISIKLNPEKQNPHIFSSSEYNPNINKSYFEITFEQLQEILNNNYATGKIYIKSDGQIKEVISLSDNIATVVDKNGNIIGKTNNITVHYSKSRTHIVPAQRRADNES